RCTQSWQGPLPDAEGGRVWRELPDQPGARPGDPRADGPDRAVEDPGDVLVGEPLKVAEEQRAPHVLRKGRERLHDCRPREPGDEGALEAGQRPAHHGFVCGLEVSVEQGQFRTCPACAVSPNPAVAGEAPGASPAMVQG